MLNFIKVFVVISSIHFVTLGNALGAVATCSRVSDKAPLFTVTTDNGDWKIISAL